MLLKLIRASCAQSFYFSQTAKSSQIRLYKPHIEQFFQNDLSLLDKEVKDVAKKYSLSQKGVEKLFRLKPKVFIPGSQDRTEVESKIKFLNKLEETEPLAALVNELLFDSRHLLVEMSEQDILNFILTIKSYGFDEPKATTIFASCTNLIHKKFDLLYQDKLAIFQDYLHLSKEEALQIFIAQPFLLTCSTLRLRQTVVFFVQNKNNVLTHEKIIDLLRNLGEIFLTGNEELVDLVKWYRSWGVEKEELWRILLEHPLLLLNHASQVFHFKAKMFRTFKFTLEMGELLLKKHPSALICSVRSLESKLLVARDRLKIKLTANNVDYLTYKFAANIRPRAEMLIRAKIPYTSEDIVDYLRCNDAEFAAKTGIPMEKLEEEKLKFPITMELDFPHRRCLKNYPTEKKIYEMSKRYYSEEDLILKGKQ